MFTPRELRQTRVKTEEKLKEPLVIDDEFVEDEDEDDDGVDWEAECWSQLTLLDEALDALKVLEQSPAEYCFGDSIWAEIVKVKDKIAKHLSQWEMPPAEVQTVELYKPEEA